MNNISTLISDEDLKNAIKNVLIEYQGEQHYFPIEWFGGEKQFERQLFNDEEKEKIAENNNLKLIKISYNDYDNIDNIIHKIIFGSTTKCL